MPAAHAVSKPPCSSSWHFLSLRPRLLLIIDPSALQDPPVPLGFLSVHKTSPNGAMQSAFPALQGGVGRGGGSSPRSPSLLLRGLCFLAIETFLMLCVTAWGFLSFSARLDFGCKFLSTVQECAYVHREVYSVSVGIVCPCCTHVEMPVFSVCMAVYCT